MDFIYKFWKPGDHEYFDNDKFKDNFGQIEQRDEQISGSLNDLSADINGLQTRTNALETTIGGVIGLQAFALELIGTDIIPPPEEWKVFSEWMHRVAAVPAQTTTLTDYTILAALYIPSYNSDIVVTSGLFVNVRGKITQFIMAARTNPAYYSDGILNVTWGQIVYFVRSNGTDATSVLDASIADQQLKTNYPNVYFPDWAHNLHLIHS